MKKIEAVIKPFKLDEVKDALHEVGSPLGNPKWILNDHRRRRRIRDAPRYRSRRPEAPAARRLDSTRSGSDPDPQKSLRKYSTLAAASNHMATCISPALPVSALTAT